MNVAYWNVEGIALPAKHKELVLLMKTYKIALLFLTETQVRTTGEYEIECFFSLSSDNPLPKAKGSDYSHTGVGVIIAPHYR